MNIAIIFVLTLFVSYTSYKSIALVPSHPLTIIMLTIAFFCIMISGLLLPRMNEKYFKTKWFSVLTWVSSTFMGLWAAFFILSLPADFILLVLSFFKVTPPLELNISFIILVLSVVITVIGFLQVLAGPRIKKITIAIKGLPQGLKHLKIAQISDLHIGSTIQTRYVKKVVQKTNALSPDFIFITGDLVDAKAQSVKDFILPLKDLKARYGTYYVTGNHEYYWGVEQILEELRKTGMIILLNDNHVENIQGENVLIAGITDPTGGHFNKDHRSNLKKAHASSMKAQLKILLSHRPDPYKDASELGFHLQFSGHTHAGQFFPFNLFIPLAHKYYKGLNLYRSLFLYVNPGTGYWGPANRFGIASEITLVEITD